MSLIDQVYKKRSKKDTNEEVKKESKKLEKREQTPSSPSISVEQKTPQEPQEPQEKEFNKLEEAGEVKKKNSKKESKKDSKIVQEETDQEGSFFDPYKLNSFKLFLNCKKLFDKNLFYQDSLDSLDSSKFLKLLISNEKFSDFFYIKNESVVIPFNDIKIAFYLKEQFESFLDTNKINSFFLNKKIFLFEDLDKLVSFLDTNLNDLNKSKCLFCPFFIKKDKEFKCTL